MSDDALAIRGDGLLVPGFPTFYSALALHHPGSGSCCEEGACCLPNGECRDNISEGDCTDYNGIWFPGGSCDQNPCLGPCCLPDYPNGSTCEMRGKAQCLADNGTWMGFGKTCSEITCPTMPCPYCIGGFMPPALMIIEWIQPVQSCCGTYEVEMLGDTYHEHLYGEDCWLAEYLPDGEPTQHQARRRQCNQWVPNCQDCQPTWNFDSHVSEGVGFWAQDGRIHFGWEMLYYGCCTYTVNAASADFDVGPDSGPIECNGVWEKETVIVPGSCPGSYSPCCYYIAKVTVIVGNGGGREGEQLLLSVRSQMAMKRTHSQNRSSQIVVPDRSLILPSSGCTGCRGRGQKVKDAWPAM